MSSTEPWQFLVVRTQNLHFLRPEKTWRPIVTLEVDDTRRSSHEVVLGTDGQNPNLKQPMLLEEVHHGSRLEIRVWHRSQTKAKRRKAHLVGSASALLGEVVKRQGDDRHVEIRLSCTSAQRRKSAVQKQPSAASLLVRIAPPRALSSASALTFSDEDYDDGDDGSVISSRKSPGSTLVSLPEEGDAEDAGDSTLNNEPPAQLLRRRRQRKTSKPKPYCLDSDVAEPSESEYESESAEDSDDRFPPDRVSDGETFDDDTASLRVRIRSESVSDVSLGVDDGSAGGKEPLPFYAPSTLPAWRAASDAVSVASTVSFASSVFDTFTYYRELREAQLDCDFESILLKLMGEWYYVGASLLAVAGLDTAVFGFSPDAIFGVDTFAKRAVTVSSIAAGIGIGIDAWFLFAYSGADVRKFQILAVDLYSSFFFFSLTSRMPLVALLVAAVTLMLFLFAIAWSAWPTAVLAMSFISGTLFSLQFIVYGCHRAVLAAVWGVQGVGRGARWAWRRALGRRGEDVEDAGAGDRGCSGAEAVAELHTRSAVGAGQPQIQVSFAPVIPREPEPCR